MTRIEFVIDELVLIGFAERDRHRIAAAVEEALTNLSGEARRAVTGAVTGDMQVATLRAPVVRPAERIARTASDAVGAGVGESIVRALVHRTGGHTARGMTRE